LAYTRRNAGCFGANPIGDTNMKTRKMMTTLGLLAIGLSLMATMPSASAYDIVHAGTGGSGDNCAGTTEVDGCQYHDPNTGQTEGCAVWIAGWCYVGT
jgi:hypothetical protein